MVTEIEQEAVRGAILFEANKRQIVKRDHIRGYPNRGLFFVGIVVADVTDKEENSFCDIELFVSSFEDCLLLTLNESVRIHRDAIVSKVGEEHFEKGCDFVKLTEVSYETFLRYQNDAWKTFCQTKKAVKRTATSTLMMMKTQQTSSLEECHFPQHPGELSSAQIVWTFSSFFTDFL